MSISKHLRGLHKWGGIIFLFPAFIISITAILLALNGVFHFDRIIINNPFPGKTKNKTEIKAAITVKDKLFIGARTGLCIIEDDSCIAVPELSGFDIKALLAINDTVFIGTKQGLWRYSDNSAIQVFYGDIFNISHAGEFLILSMGKGGIRIIDFEGNENIEMRFSELVEKKLEMISNVQPQTLHKLIMDLHTGEAIVGKSLKDYWIFLGGFGLLLISVSGLWIIIGKKRKRNLSASL